MWASIRGLDPGPREFRGKPGQSSDRRSSSLIHSLCVELEPGASCLDGHDLLSLKVRLSRTLCIMN